MLGWETLCETRSSVLDTPGKNCSFHKILQLLDTLTLDLYSPYISAQLLSWCRGLVSLCYSGAVTAVASPGIGPTGHPPSGVCCPSHLDSLVHHPFPFAVLTIVFLLHSSLKGSGPRGRPGRAQQRSLETLTAFRRTGRAAGTSCS